MLRLRAFLLWAVMLAVPFQGYAAASMAFCAMQEQPAVAAASSHGDAHAGSHDHGAHQHLAATDSHAKDDGHDGHDHTSGTAHKCGTCGACHAVALTSALPVLEAHGLPPADLAEPSSAIATVSPSVPDKPPRG